MTTARRLAGLGAVAVAILVVFWYRPSWRHSVRQWLGLPSINDVVQSLIPRRALPLQDLGARPMVILVTGQSNAGNYGIARRGPAGGVYNFYRGRILEARDPMLGSDALGAAPWVRVGEELMKSGSASAVVFALAVRGGMPIAEWREGRPLYQLALETAGELAGSGLSISQVFWQQGESDCSAVGGTSASEYRSAFSEFLAGLRNAGVRAPVFVALASRSSESKGCGWIREAQASLVSAERGVLAGPDTDSLGPELRYDGVHFTSEGLDAVARLWSLAVLASPERRLALTASLPE